ncbi:MAG: hypothetical protein FWD78_05445 [Treponema sp.]|nr:hypothetical protein [Treponema sp.]
MKFSVCIDSVFRGTDSTAALETAGYRGYIGPEYFPAGTVMDNLKLIREKII